MAALDAALALAEVDERAVRVAQDLDLDVARPRDVPLEQHPVVAERRGRLAPGGLERLASSAGSRTTRIPRPPPPALALTSSG